jgi:hypothetical protein
MSDKLLLEAIAFSAGTAFVMLLTGCLTILVIELLVRRDRKKSR